MQAMMDFQLSSLLSRYTSQTFAMVPTRVLDAFCSQALCANAVVLYMWMCDKANSHGKLWWSVAKMAEVFDTTERSLCRWIGRLVDTGLIERARRCGRSSITTVLGHPKAVSIARQYEKDERKPAPNVVHDPECHDEHDPQRHVEQEPGEPESHDPTSTVRSTRSAPTTAVDDDDVESWDLERLWGLAETAGLPAFRGFARSFVQSPESLDTVLSLSDDALLWAFQSIEDGPAQLYPRTAKYWLVRLAEQAALYRPSQSAPVPQPIEPDETLSAATEETTEASPRPPVWLKTPTMWAAVLQAIEEMVPNSTFTRWFSSLAPGLDGDDGLLVWAPERFDAAFVEKNFADLIRIHANHHGIPCTRKTMHFIYPENADRYQVDEYRICDVDEMPPDSILCRDSQE